MRPLRRGTRGRDRVPRHGAPRRRALERPAGQGRAPARADAAVRRRDRGRARQGAPAGDRASGPQARQRDDHEVGREAARLRSRQGDGGAREALGRHVAPDGDGLAEQPDAGRDDPRHVPVHGARTARGKGGGRAHGHFRVRRGAVRDGDGKEGVCRRDTGFVDFVDPSGRPAADLAGPVDVASRPGPRGPGLPCQGPRGPAPVRSRHRIGAEMDLGRLQRGHRAADGGGGAPASPRAARLDHGRARRRGRRAVDAARSPPCCCARVTDQVLDVPAAAAFDFPTRSPCRRTRTASSFSRRTRAASGGSGCARSTS